MRWATILSAVLLAGLIFFSLCMAALDRDTQRYGHALDALDALDMADTNLDNDVLKARIGLLRDYDSLVTGDAHARDTLQHLRRLADHDPALCQAIAALDADYTEKSLQRELFKSQNSLLSNSLAYFWSESSAQIRQGDDPAAARAASMLASAVQRLSLDTTGEAVALARRRLDEAAQRTTSTPLLPHGRMLLKLLPETDTTIRRMRPIASLASYAQLKTYLQKQHACQQATARQVRFLLLGLAVVMLGALLYLATLLRQRARVLRRRAEFDRLMVAVSRRLVANDRHQLDAGIEAGLMRLAKWAKLPSARLGVVSVGADARIWPDPQDEAFRTMLAAVAATGPVAASDVLVVHANGTVEVLGKPERVRGAQWLCLRQHSEAATVALLCLRLPPLSARRDRGLAALAELLPQLHIALDTLFDALERRRLEDEARALEHRLELARRMETLGTMASGISHNFNNIVGAIRGNAEIALSKLDPHSPASEHLLEISHTTAHAYDLIESILSFGRVQNYNVQPVELNALLQGAVSLLSVSLPSTVTIALQQEQEPLHALGNPAQLQQVILNLPATRRRRWRCAGRSRFNCRPPRAAQPTARPVASRSCVSATTASAFLQTNWIASSISSSPPAIAAPGWDWQRFARSSTTTKGGSTWTARCVSARPSWSSCHCGQALQQPPRPRPCRRRDRGMRACCCCATTRPSSTAWKKCWPHWDTNRSAYWSCRQPSRWQRPTRCASMACCSSAIVPAMPNTRSTRCMPLRRSCH